MDMSSREIVIKPRNEMKIKLIKDNKDGKTVNEMVCDLKLAHSTVPTN